MNLIHSLRIAGIVSFDQPAELKITKGLTGILGRNLNRRDAGASNGSGKSVLVGSLPNALFDSSSFITKNGRSVTKGLFRKGGKIEVEFSPHGSKSKFVYTKGASKVSMTENGHDIQTRVGRESLRARLDMTEDEFWATTYIDSRRPNSFLMGSPSDRFAFITNLFRLNDIDERRRIFNRRIQELKETAAQLTVLRSEFGQAKEEWEKLPKADPTAIAEKQSKLKAAQAAVQEATVQMTAHEAYARYVKASKAVAAIPTPDVSEKQARAAIRLWDQYEASQRSHEDTKKRYARLRKERDDLGVDNWVSWYDVMVERRELLRKENPRVRERPEDMPKPSPAAKRAYDNRAKIEQRLSLLKGQLAERKQSLRHFNAAFAKLSGVHEKAADCQCPTCYQPLTTKTQASIRKGLADNVAALEEQYSRMVEHEAAADQWEGYLKYCEDRKSWERYMELTKEGYSMYPFDMVERHMAITKVLKQAVGDAPQEPDTITREEAEEILAQWARKNQAQQALDMLGDVERPKWSREKAADIAKRAGATVTAIMAQLPTMQMQAEMRKQIGAKCKRLSEEIAEAKKAVRDLPVLELLTKAFSPDGIKLLITRSIAAKLEKNMNRFAKTVYEGENFRFEINVDAGQFSVIVHRRGSDPCDVRSFSGAESRLFILMFLLSLLPMIPSKRRTNMLILDEPCIGMDSQNQDRFRNRLLPAMLKIVPSVIIATPNIDDLPTWARKLTVVKQGGTSTLTEGVYVDKPSTPKKTAKSKVSK